MSHFISAFINTTVHCISADRLLVVYSAYLAFATTFLCTATFMLQKTHYFNVKMFSILLSYINPFLGDQGWEVILCFARSQKCAHSASWLPWSCKYYLLLFSALLGSLFFQAFPTAVFIYSLLASQHWQSQVSTLLPVNDTCVADGANGLVYIFSGSM